MQLSHQLRELEECLRINKKVTMTAVKAEEWERRWYRYGGGRVKNEAEREDTAWCMSASRLADWLRDSASFIPSGPILSMIYKPDDGRIMGWNIGVTVDEPWERA